MRVKVGDTWHSAFPNRPIMVELSPYDKNEIKNMASSENRYAIFTDKDSTTDEEKASWIKT